MTFRRLARAAAVAMLASGCSPLLEAHGGPVAPVEVSSRSSFTLAPLLPPPAGYKGSERSLEVARRVGVVATRLLEARGYTLASGAAPADLRVEIRAGHRDEKLAPVFPMPLPRAGSPDRPELSEAEDARTGALVVDVYDASSGVLAWHGAAEVVIDGDAIDDGLIERATTATLATFPARAGGMVTAPAPR